MGSLYLYLSLYLLRNKFKAYQTISTAININVQIHTADFYIMTLYKQFSEYQHFDPPEQWLHLSYNIVT